MTATRIRVGVGGWTYEPWRETFYPADVPASKELAYASRQLSTIEINATFYRNFKPANFEKWSKEVPDDFVFSVKATRYATYRKTLAESGESVARFFGSGVTTLGSKLGPIVWQLQPTHRFDAADIAAFFALLPRKLDGIAIRHAIDVRHESFGTPEFVELARRNDVAIVFEDTDDHAAIAAVTSGFVYARLMRTQSEIATGYSARDLKRWAGNASVWQSGGEPDGLPSVGKPAAKSKPRDVFVYFISGAKERAPAAAQALIKLLA